MIFSVKLFTKICIPLWSLSTKWRVDCFLVKINLYWSSGMPYLFWIFALTLSMVSLLSTSKIIIFFNQGLNKNLHRSTQMKHEVKDRFLLNVIISQCAAVLQSFFGKDKPLLIWRNYFLILNLNLDNGVVLFYLKDNSLLGQGFFRKISMSPRGGKTRWRVDSFWML